MNAPAAQRKGWCPGALRPMPTGDGLLVRVRLACRRLDPALVEALADCAAQFGNGVIEMSSRANLQLRGIREAALQGLQRRLDELGLLDADADADAESVGNILASPLSDIDPDAIIDVGPIVAAIEARLRNDSALRRLPPKFAFLVDSGGAAPLGDFEADIRFEASRGEDGTCFAVRLAGAEGVAALCAPRQASDIAAQLARAFIDGAAAQVNAPRRMRALVAERGAGEIFAAAGLMPVMTLPPTRRVAAPGDILGVLKVGACHCVGAAAPLGRLSAGDLRALAQAARRFSARDIRLTPWRAFVITGLDHRGAENLAAALGERGFILDPDDRRLAVVACAGAPACANAARPVQREALEFAAAIARQRGVVLHVSGCPKGCAHGRAAALTLVARDSGYDLVLGGKASDRPSYFALSQDEAMALVAQSEGRAR
jgi:precorrin-3B synthase